MPAKTDKLWLPPGSAPGSSEHLKLALEYAIREWEAEQENSRRLATRANAILATVAVLSGLGVFKLNELGRTTSSPVSLFVNYLLVVAIASMLIGMLHVWDLRPPPVAPGGKEAFWHVRRKALRLVRTWSWYLAHGSKPVDADSEELPFASSELFASSPVTDGRQERPTLVDLSADEVMTFAFYRTSQAAASLHLRNIQRRTSLAVGQQWLAGAAACAFLAAACLLTCPQAGASDTKGLQFKAELRSIR